MVRRKDFFWLVMISFLSLAVFCSFALAGSQAGQRQVLGEKTISLSQVKEVYIPLGQGSTSSAAWVEITGAEAVIDKNNFSGIKSIIFEASMRIPTGNGRVHVKLFNVSEKHDVWFSEVWSEGDQSKREESAPISLGAGRQLYRVMMKSSMGYEAVLDQARLKIVLY